MGSGDWCRKPDSRFLTMTEPNRFKILFKYTFMLDFLFHLLIVIYACQWHSHWLVTDTDSVSVTVDLLRSDVWQSLHPPFTIIIRDTLTSFATFVHNTFTHLFYVVFLLQACSCVSFFCQMRSRYFSFFLQSPFCLRFARARKWRWLVDYGVILMTHALFGHFAIWSQK